jgi:hypothetical protein
MEADLGVLETSAFDEAESLYLRSRRYLTACEGVSRSFRTGRLEQELQMVQLSATMYSYIAILWVSLVSFAAITLCIASQRVFFIIIIIVYFVTTQSGNFWIQPLSIESWSVNHFCRILTMLY